MELEKLIEAAQEWAEQSVPVFPCASNKRPLTKHGHKDAVTDPKEVEELFRFFGNSTTYIGARMGKESGLFAIDVDLYKGEAPQAYVDMLIEQNLLPETRIHQTKNGGTHMIYRSDKAWPNVVPAVGVEIKGEGGYIIVPPSEGYTVIREGVAEAPPKLIEFLLETKREASAQNVDALKMKVLDGSEFHDSLRSIAAKRSKRGVPVEAIMKELRDVLSESVAKDVNHERHQRWASLYYNEGKELTRLVGQGNQKFNPSVKREEFFDAMEGHREEIAAVAKLAFIPHPVNEPEVAPKTVEDFGDDWPFANDGTWAHEELDLLNMEFTIEGLLAEGEVAVMFADPKVGKTALNVSLSLHKACGMDLGPLKMHDARPCLYYALEGNRAIKMRIDAWKRYHREIGTELPKDIPMFTVERPTNFLNETARIEECNKIIAANSYCLKKYGKPLGIISLDTLTRAMSGGDQNSVDDTSSLFELVGLLRQGGVTASIVIVHHKAKTGDLRGSTNIAAESDLMLDVTREGKLIRARVASARSIEEGDVYSFNMEPVSIGINKQGIELKSFVVIPTENETAMGSSDYTESVSYANMMDCLLTLGTGTHKLTTVLSLLVKEGHYETGGKHKPTVNNVDVQKFFQTSVENTTFANHAFTCVREGNKVKQLVIRSIE